MQALLDILAKVGFDWHQGLFNFINFLIIFFILKRYAFQPVLKAIHERQQKAQETMENFNLAKTELGMAQRRSQELVDESKVQANKIIEQAYEQANGLKEEMKNKAKQEIELLIEQAKRNIDIERQEMYEELRKQTVMLVMMATEKIIGEKFDAIQDESYITDVLKKIPSEKK